MPYWNNTLGLILADLHKSVAYRTSTIHTFYILTGSSSLPYRAIRSRWKISRLFSKTCWIRTYKTRCSETSNRSVRSINPATTYTSSRNNWPTRARPETLNHCFIVYTNRHQNTNQPHIVCSYVSVRTEVASHCCSSICCLIVYCHFNCTEYYSVLHYKR